MKLLHELLRLELKSTAFIRTQWPEVTEWPSKSGSLVINHFLRKLRPSKALYRRWLTGDDGIKRRVDER